MRAARRAKEAQLEAAAQQARIEVQEYAKSSEWLQGEQLMLQMNRRMAQAEEHNRFLSAQLRTSQTEVAELTKLNEQINRLNVVKDERLHEALALIGDLEARLTQTASVRQMVQRAGQQVTAMEQRLEAQALHMQELQRENQRLTTEMANQAKLVAVNEAHAREAEVAALHGVIQKLQAEVGNERKHKAEAEQRTVELQKSFEVERKAHEERLVHYARMAEANEMYRSKNAALEEAARRLQEANSEASKQITRHEARIAELSSVLSRHAILQQRKDGLPSFGGSRRPSENGGLRSSRSNNSRTEQPNHSRKNSFSSNRPSFTGRQDPDQPFPRSPPQDQFQSMGPRPALHGSFVQRPSYDGTGSAHSSGQRDWGSSLPPLGRGGVNPYNGGSHHQRTTSDGVAGQQPQAYQPASNAAADGRRRANSELGYMSSAPTPQTNGGYTVFAPPVVVPAARGSPSRLGMSAGGASAMQDGPHEPADDGNAPPFRLSSSGSFVSRVGAKPFLGPASPVMPAQHSLRSIPEATPEPGSQSWQVTQPPISPQEAPSHSQASAHTVVDMSDQQQEQSPQPAARPTRSGVAVSSNNSEEDASAADQPVNTGRASNQAEASSAPLPTKAAIAATYGLPAAPANPSPAAVQAPVPNTATSRPSSNRSHALDDQPAEADDMQIAAGMHAEAVSSTDAEVSGGRHDRAPSPPALLSGQPTLTAPEEAQHAQHDPAVTSSPADMGKVPDEAPTALAVDLSSAGLATGPLSGPEVFAVPSIDPSHVPEQEQAAAADEQ